MNFGTHYPVSAPWRVVNHFVVNANNEIVASTAQTVSAMPWENTPADLATSDKTRAFAALPVLVDALRIALFGVSSDADTSGGTVDRIAIAATIREALTAAGIDPTP